MTVAQVHIDPAEQRPLVHLDVHGPQGAGIDAVDGADDVVQSVDRRVGDPEHIGCDRRGWGPTRLPIRGEEEVCPIPHDRARHRRPELVRAEVLGRITEKIVPGQVLVAEVLEERAVIVIGARLGHRIHQAAGEPTLRHVVLVGEDLKLLHGLDREGHRQPIAAARVAAEERSGVLHAVDVQDRPAVAGAAD